MTTKIGSHIFEFRHIDEIRIYYYVMIPC